MIGEQNAVYVLLVGCKTTCTCEIARGMCNFVYIVKAIVKQFFHKKYKNGITSVKEVMYLFC